MKTKNILLGLLLASQHAPLKKLHGSGGFNAKTPFVHADPIALPAISNTAILLASGT